MTEDNCVRPIALVDTTLRDGAQTPGLALSGNQKRVIARLLDDIGVDELEAGTPVMGPDERDVLRALLAMGLHCRITGWCRAHREDLRQARRCGLRSIHIGIPVSDIHLDAMGRDRAWVMRQLRELVQPATGDFEHVSVGAQDATRTSQEFLSAVAVEVAAANAARMRLADTVGVAHPLQTASLVAALRATAPELPLEYHAHNDLGMATANAVAAAAAGAGAVSVTVNGLGERAGNAPLEEVATALWRCRIGRITIHLERLTRLCRAVAEITENSLPSTKPVVGASVFVHESGIHCNGLVNDPATFEPFAPDRVGQKPSRFVAGTHSGAAGIRRLMADHGISIGAHVANRMRPVVQSTARNKGRSLSRKELMKIYRCVIKPSF
jgi:homocitrate synthase NifV